MIDPNVVNYFLVVLGGFSVVWSYRHFTKQQEKKIGEFEYAAFSALWGIVVFLLYVYMGKPEAKIWDLMFQIPMLTTPTLVFIGTAMGIIGALVRNHAPAVKRYIVRKWKKL